MTVLIIILLLILATFAAMAVKRVPTGQVHSLYRHGKPVRLLQPGTHVVMPLFDRVAHRIDLGGHILRFQEALAGTHDVSGRVYWQVLEPEHADAVIEQADQLIRRGALDALHGEPEAAAAGDCRDLGLRMKQALNLALRERGMMVTRVELEFA